MEVEQNNSAFRWLQNSPGAHQFSALICKHIFHQIFHCLPDIEISLSISSHPRSSYFVQRGILSRKLFYITPNMRPTTFLSHILLGLLMLMSLARSQEGVQFALFRRRGALATRDNVNLTYLTHLLRHTELRYGRTKRVFKDNGIIRRWKSSSSGTAEDHDLLSGTAHDDGW
jgi:hypothetical protein